MTSLSEADFAGVESSLSKFANLTELTLKSVKLNTLECLLPLKTLKKLTLSGKTITDYYRWDLEEKN
ncbi:hypothetical protein D0T84_16890 [Dysgonomonas sp. 521]|uniref:hypothetical protein n=1 Tax=Dysgonomonas sp. 521 TaxID=2302932 RepID=UPI0013CF7809|nr:hypothetical protein [Dysgonomonas sp. 521]NDV96578.1 hypothetical protein [Dysgonomonas sp. 521]